MAGWLRRGLENPCERLAAERKKAILGWKMGWLEVCFLVGYWKMAGWLASCVNQHTNPQKLQEM